MALIHVLRGSIMEKNCLEDNLVCLLKVRMHQMQSEINFTFRICSPVIHVYMCRFGDTVMLTVVFVIAKDLRPADSVMRAITWRGEDSSFAAPDYSKSSI